jgi:hemerythrin-like metal-binding protein
MHRLEWDAALDTGEPLVDQQHRTFIDLLNDLMAVDDSDTARIVAALNRLADHTLVHFATEEALMTRRAYPEDAAEAHVLEHRVLAAEQRTMGIDYRRGWTTGTAPMIDHMMRWLTEHIETQDRLLVEHIRTHGPAD